MKPPPTPLARPTTQERWERHAARRDDFTLQERRGLIFSLEDYAEMLEMCAMGVDDDGPIDRDTRQRVDRARVLANRFK